MPTCSSLAEMSCHVGAFGRARAGLSSAICEFPADCNGQAMSLVPTGPGLWRAGHDHGRNLLLWLAATSRTNTPATLPLPLPISPALPDRIEASRRRTYRTAFLLCALVLIMIVLQRVSGHELRVPYFVSLHLIVEQLSIGMSLLIALMAWFRTEGSSRHRVFAVGFLVAALLDMLHAASYAGLPDLISPSSPHKAIVFWLAARFTVAFAVLASLVPLARQRQATVLLLLYGVTIAAVGLVAPDVFPRIYVDGEGLTPLKIKLEWLITLSYLGLAAIVARQPEHNLPYYKIAAGLLVLAVGELLFTQYRQVDGFGNAAGHLAKIVGQAFLLHAVIEARLLRPYRQLEAERQAHDDALIKMNALFAGAPLGILVTDQDGNIVRGNRTADEMFHARSGQLVGMSVDTLVPVEVRHHHPRYRSSYQQQPRNIAMSARPDLEAQRLDGSRFYVAVALAPLQWDGKAHTLAFISDVSQQVLQVHKLKWLTQHDELTRLPNRRAVEGILAEQIKQAPGAVVVLGVDSLKRVNQVFGHEVGDRLLSQAAERLMQAIQPGDVLARLQGDTFVVVLPNVTDIETRSRMLLAAFQAPFELPPDISLHATATGGYVSYPAGGNEPKVLLQHAELAMASAKRNQRRDMAGFDARQPVRAQRWLELASRMEDALHDGEFQLVYQPRVQLATGAVAGFEALCRWHSKTGPINPAEFIPVAEETGYIIELGRWILETAIVQQAGWIRAGLSVGRMAVNLSPRQLADPELVGHLQTLLQRHQLAPALLELELTETAAMENLDWALAPIHALAALGVRVALDDFGTGYSSLSYLQSLPLSVLKIDAAFVRQLETDTGQSVARTIIALARSLNYSTVAEGVETEPQRQWLQQQGCDEMQGYLEAKPMPPTEVERYLEVRR